MANFFTPASIGSPCIVTNIRIDEPKSLISNRYCFNYRNAKVVRQVSDMMYDDSGYWLQWLPIVLAGIGLNFGILWYLLVEWPTKTAQSLPLLGYGFSGISILVIAGLLANILNAMFGSAS